LSGFLAALFRLFAEAGNAGRVFAAPFQMKLPNVRRGREPDLLFVTTENLPRIEGTYLDGPADLVVEIVLPESVLRDRGAKYGEYEIGGVREYWILDPEARRADFFVLGEDGRYERRRPDDRDIYVSTVLPGLRLNVNWLWRRPLPPLREAMHDWQLP
jgi:Uma2 family endonuclease